MNRVGETFNFPKGHYVYCLWGVDEEIPIYVGRSSSVLQRLVVHEKDPLIGPHIKEITLTKCNSFQHSKMIESDLIKKYQPRFNDQGIDRSHSTLILDMGDGRYLVNGNPPVSVLRAAKRINDALMTGRKPRKSDMDLTMKWVDRDYGKYGGIRQA